jgi:hypothetical protein
MRISGFSFCRNAAKLYYPVAESIRSVLPVCDEFIVAVGKGDPDDNTREVIEAIGDPKIRIIDTEWTDRERLQGWIHSQQTNIALNACSGDWCIYVQSDEVVHERDLPVIKQLAERLLKDNRVEGLAFRYLHFWGDYHHVHNSHAWYPTEVRMIRNGLGIQSFRSAQSFRRNGKRLRAVATDAEIFHYGWVRPPRLMRVKNYEMMQTHHGKQRADEARKSCEDVFDYGSLEQIPVYNGTHPSVMKEWMATFNWQDELQHTGPSRVSHRHDQFKQRLLTWIEQKLLDGKIRLGVKPYRPVRGVPAR